MASDTLRKIEIDGTDILFYFEGSDEPFMIEEFEPGSPTRTYLRHIQVAICAQRPVVQEQLFSGP